MEIETIQIITAGLRALLFATAFLSAMTFIQEIRPTYTLVCTLIRHGRIREDQFVGFAAFGWFVMALSSMLFTFNRLLKAITEGVNPHGLTTGWDGVWTAVGFFGMSLGFFIPVLAMLWYRQRLVVAVGLGLACCMFGITYAILAQRLPWYQISH